VDWFDPEIWKVPAALAEHWQKIAVAIVAIVGAVGTVLKWGLAPIRWLAAKFRAIQRQPSPLDERPLRFVLDEGRSFWGPARNGDQALTQVAGHWDVTNVSDRDVVILGARLANHSAQTTLVLTKSPVAGVRTFGSRNPIPANTMSEIMITLFFCPPICDGYDPLLADVIFTDNYEGQHIVRQVRFCPIRPVYA
jgi:hypothetical protein